MRALCTPPPQLLCEHLLANIGLILIYLLLGLVQGNSGENQGSEGEETGGCWTHHDVVQGVQLQLRSPCSTVFSLLACSMYVVGPFIGCRLAVM